MESSYKVAGDKGCGKGGGEGEGRRVEEFMMDNEMMN